MATEPISDEDIWKAWRVSMGSAQDFARAILRLAAERIVIHPGLSLEENYTIIRRVLTGGER